MASDVPSTSWDRFLHDAWEDSPSFFEHVSNDTDLPVGDALANLSTPSASSNVDDPVDTNTYWHSSMLTELLPDVSVNHASLLTNEHVNDQRLLFSSNDDEQDNASFTLDPTMSFMPRPDATNDHYSGSMIGTVDYQYSSSVPSLNSDPSGSSLGRLSSPLYEHHGNASINSTSLPTSKVMDHRQNPLAEQALDTNLAHIGSCFDSGGTDALGSETESTGHDMPSSCTRFRQSAVDKKHHCSDPGCSKSFQYPKDVRRHEKTHSGVKDYFCPHSTCVYSQRGFPRKDNLDRHLRTAH